MILKNLNKYSQFFKEYTELRVQGNRNIWISILNGNVVGNEKSVISGVSARVYKNGFWGFASNPELNDKTIKQVIISATENAKFISSREKGAKPALPSRNAVSENDLSTEKKKISQKDKIAFIKEIDNYIKEKFTKLTSRRITLESLYIEKSLLTSDGSYLYSMIPRSIIYVNMNMEKDGEPYELYNVFGGLGEYEDNFDNPKELFSELDKQYEHLLNKSEGVFAKAGIHDCILDANLAGDLAHEAIGHTTEADGVKGGSIAGDYLNKKVAADIVTLVDFAHHYKGKICPVPVFIDDEGTKAEDAVIIENGILKNFMNSKEYANYFGMELTGNARAYTFSDEPLVRMRNTAILPGKSMLEDMIASIENGYYLMKSNDGQADATSEFMFGVVLGYEIKNGKLGKAIKDTTISGVAFDVLKSITMISDDMVWSIGGMCGKKQLITVGMGGPAIKCRINIGGK